MKCLTICQPYAHLVIHGPEAGSELAHWGRKMYENRTWASDYRGPLAIHAGLSRTWLDLDMLPKWGLNAGRLVFGAILGIVQMNGSMGRRSATGPWVSGGDGYVHVYTRVIRVLEKPVPYKGQQGFFEVPDELLEGMPGGGAGLAPESTAAPREVQGGLFR